MRQHYTRVHLNMDDMTDVVKREEAYKKPVVIQRQDDRVTSVFEGVTVEDAVIAETISVAEDGSILSVKNNELAPLSSLVGGQPPNPLQLFSTDLSSDNLTQSISIVTADLSANTVEAAPSFDVKGLCQQCGKVFQDPVQHYRNVHAKDRPYKCHLCSFSHPLKGIHLQVSESTRACILGPARLHCACVVFV